jgi:hypothetical protein
MCVIVQGTSIVYSCLVTLLYYVYVYCKNILEQTVLHYFLLLMTLILCISMLILHIGASFFYFATCVYCHQILD